MERQNAVAVRQVLEQDRSEVGERGAQVKTGDRVELITPYGLIPGTLEDLETDGPQTWLSVRLDIDLPRMSCLFDTLDLDKVIRLAEPRPGVRQ